MCNRALLLFGKMPQRNLYVNCHVNETRFQSALSFQTGLNSLRVPCKRALRRDQVHLLVYGPDRPYFKQKQKNDITKFWPTGFF